MAAMQEKGSVTITSSVFFLGAILQVGEHYMTCDRANDFETNGALKWIPLEQANQAKPSSQAPDPNVKTYSIK